MRAMVAGERQMNEGTTMSAGANSTLMHGPGLHKAVLCAGLLISLIFLGFIAADRAEAHVGINSIKVETSNTQAGGHPNVAFLATFDNTFFNGVDEEGKPIGNIEDELPPGDCSCEDARVITQHFPTGFIGDPHAVPRCTLVEFGLGECPVGSQVGVVQIYLGYLPLQVALYNLLPHPEEAGSVGFFAPGINAQVFTSLNGRTDSDYGLDATTAPIYHYFPLNGVDTYLWGIPASPENDLHRFPSPEPGLGCLHPYPESCSNISSDAPEAPFLLNPTTCGVPLTAALTIDYYTHKTVQAETSWPATTGCDQLSFDPSLSAHPTTSQADTASGIDINLKVPQTQSPTVPSPSELRTATVTLPEGFSINPNAADGKVACTDAEGSFGTRAAASCPETAKVGTLQIDSSALPGPIDGAIYLGQPQPGNRYRLFVAADGFATHVKLAGSVHPDPQTGRIVVTFTDLPQSPLQEFSMHMFGSERGSLATPTRCGTYPVQSEFVPWDTSLPTQLSTSFFTIDSGPNGGPCPEMQRPFDPVFVAGSARNTAGAHSSFGVQLDREDGDQNLTGLNVSTPPGFSASLRGIPYCPEAAIARLSEPGYSGLLEQGLSACPIASRIGVVTTGAGAGNHPLYTPGTVYLAGPYKGAPLSLEVVIPAVSGPYDLGTVAVRAAVFVDPVTAQVKTVSDPLPQILEGIPLRLRSFQVKLDRPNFALNPTNCAPLGVNADIFGDQGAVANPNAPFQAANCADLPYEPKLSLRLSGGLNRRGHPAIKAIFTARPGEANTRKATVVLPQGELLDNSHIGTVCTRPQFAARACPSSALLGTAEVTTPLLNRPLTGKAFLRSSSRDLPDIALDLQGQVDFELALHVDSVNARFRTVLESAPDVPVTQLVLNLAGGKKGLLQNSESLCEKPKKATTTLLGQNGALVKTQTELQLRCGKRARHKRHLQRARKVR